MNTYEITYDGNLRTSALHVDSNETIHTDAPKDNEGLGESFSPTDMVCTALGSCILTIMAIAARKKGIEIAIFYLLKESLCTKIALEYYYL